MLDFSYRFYLSLYFEQDNYLLSSTFYTLFLRVLITTNELRNSLSLAHARFTARVIFLHILINSAVRICHVLRVNLHCVLWRPPRTDGWTFKDLRLREVFMTSLWGAEQNIISQQRNRANEHHEYTARVSGCAFVVKKVLKCLFV